jgi:hypothetical protein
MDSQSKQVAEYSSRLDEYDKKFEENSRKFGTLLTVKRLLIDFFSFNMLRSLNNLLFVFRN